MSSFEALAVAALRRWCGERQQLRNGAITSYRTSGTRRHPGALHARLVRVLSFEQVFSQLPEVEQSTLLLLYRDGLTTRAVAHSLRLSVGTTQARAAHARLTLADSLDRRNLL